MLAVVSGLAGPTYAEVTSVPYAYNVYIDTDNNPSTGCSTHVHDANIRKGPSALCRQRLSWRAPVRGRFTSSR